MSGSSEIGSLSRNEEFIIRCYRKIYRTYVVCQFWLLTNGIILASQIKQTLCPDQNPREYKPTIRTTRHDVSDTDISDTPKIIPLIGKESESYVIAASVVSCDTNEDIKSIEHELVNYTTDNPLTISTHDILKSLEYSKDDSVFIRIVLDDGSIVEYKWDDDFIYTPV